MQLILLRLSIFLVILFTAASLALRLQSVNLQENDVLAGFVAGCERVQHPCWYGIVPRITTDKEALQILDWLGYTLENKPNCCVSPTLLWESDKPQNHTCSVLYETWPLYNYSGTSATISQTVVNFRLHACDQISLGELASVLKNPITAYSCSGDMVQVAFQEENGLWWPNDKSRGGEPYRSAPPTTADASIKNISTGFFEYEIQGTYLDHSWYGFMPESELKQVIDEKYCKFG